MLLILLWCSFLFFYGIGAGELWRTENLRAIISADFLRSGNWIVPKLYGEPLFTKPPGMYAAIALLSWPIGGVNEVTARLPSALAATFTVLLFAWYFGRQLGKRAGLVAALMLPVSIMWLDKVPAAEIDMLQVAWVSAAILFALRALELEEFSTPQKCSESSCHLVILSSCHCWYWWLAALLCVAGGVLTKWTAPAFFYGTLLPLLWRRGRLRLLWGRHHLVSAAVAAGVCLAWAAAAVSLTGWDIFYDTVSREALQRLSPSHHQEAQLQLSPGHHAKLSPWAAVLAHPFVILAASLPWSVFALGTLRPGFAQRWDERGRKLLQALHCWTWPNLIFWSIIPEHAPRHSFPLIPGLTGLAVLVWISWLRESEVRSQESEVRSQKSEARWKLTPGRILIGMLVLWAMVKLTYVHVVIPSRNIDREPRAKGEQLAALVPADQPLYLFRLKDEGIMFYFGRTVLRLPSPAQLPSSQKAQYCILNESEWDQWSPSRPGEVLLHLRDEQGAPIVLIKVTG